MSALHIHHIAPTRKTIKKLSLLLFFIACCIKDEFFLLCYRFDLKETGKTCLAAKKEKRTFTQSVIICILCSDSYPLLGVVGSVYVFRNKLEARPFCEMNTGDVKFDKNYLICGALTRQVLHYF